MKKLWALLMLLPCLLLCMGMELPLRTVSLQRPELTFYLPEGFLWITPDGEIPPEAGEWQGVLEEIQPMMEEADVCCYALSAEDNAQFLVLDGSRVRVGALNGFLDACRKLVNEQQGFDFPLDRYAPGYEMKFAESDDIDAHGVVFEKRRRGRGMYEIITYTPQGDAKDYSFVYATVNAIADIDQERHADAIVTLTQMGDMAAPAGAAERTRVPLPAPPPYVAAIVCAGAAAAVWAAYAVRKSSIRRYQTDACYRERSRRAALFRRVRTLRKKGVLSQHEYERLRRKGR